LTQNLLLRSSVVLTALSIDETEVLPMLLYLNQISY